MDVEKVPQALESWIALAENARFIGGWSGDEPQVWVRKDDPAASRLRENHDQVSQLVGHVFGTSPPAELIQTSADGDLVVQHGIELAGRALGRVRTLDETRAMLGSAAPTMHADAMHPLIWDAASKRGGRGTIRIRCSGRQLFSTLTFKTSPGAPMLLTTTSFRKLFR